MRRGRDRTGGDRLPMYAWTQGPRAGKWDDLDRPRVDHGTAAQRSLRGPLAQSAATRLAVPLQYDDRAGICDSKIHLPPGGLAAAVAAVGRLGAVHHGEGIFYGRGYFAPVWSDCPAPIPRKN